MKDDGFNHYYCKKHFPKKEKRNTDLTNDMICEYKNCRKEAEYVENKMKKPLLVTIGKYLTINTKLLDQQLKWLYKQPSNNEIEGIIELLETIREEYEDTLKEVGE